MERLTGPTWLLGSGAGKMVTECGWALSSTLHRQVFRVRRKCTTDNW
jgi:hypothetical protein